MSYVNSMFICSENRISTNRPRSSLKCNCYRERKLLTDRINRAMCYCAFWAYQCAVEGRNEVLLQQQQPGGQTWNGGAQISNGGAGTTIPPRWRPPCYMHQLLFAQIVQGCLRRDLCIGVCYTSGKHGPIWANFCSPSNYKTCADLDRTARKSV